MATDRPDYDILGEYERVGDKEAEIARLEGKGAELTPLEKINLEALRAVQNVTPQDSQGEPDQAELSPERTATLAILKANYERLSHLSNGVDWSVVEKSLPANPKKLDDLARLLAERPNSDLTVVGRKDGEIKFMETAPNCPGDKNIAYDKKGEEYAKSCEGRRSEEMPRDNAVDVCVRYGAAPGSPDLYKSLKGKVPGLDIETWAWLLTDAETRKRELASFGYLGEVINQPDNGGVLLRLVHDCRANGGVRCEIGVQEVL